MLQFQLEEHHIPASGGQKGYNSNIKRGLFQQQGRGANVVQLQHQEVYQEGYVPTAVGLNG